jgi:SAM-dependent methyltransferase
MNAQLRPAERKELLLGCSADGPTTRKKVCSWEPKIPADWTNLVTLDMTAEHKPDVVHDLEILPYPFADNEFDEVHAYEVLEHTGAQGDWRFFFAQFTELHRIIKPDGYLVGSCPLWDGVWAWSDPGHRRIISRESFGFLDQRFYQDQVGKSSATDYRPYYKVSFELIDYKERGPQFFFVLQAKK